MFLARISGEKPLPRPTYYCKMNPEEQTIWHIIGEQRKESYVDTKGRMRTRRLSPQDRARKQRMFFDSRVGHAIVGDEWMRMQLPARKR